MKKKRLENSPGVQKRLQENESIEKSEFRDLLKKAVKPSSQKPA